MKEIKKTQGTAWTSEPLRMGEEFPRIFYLCAGEGDNMREDFNRVKEAADLGEFCLSHGMEKTGRNTFVCPVCGSGTGKNHTAAFTIFNDGSFKCFSCGEHGDVFDLASLLGKAGDKREQLHYVAKWSGEALEGNDQRATAQKRAATETAAYNAEGREKSKAYIARCRQNIAQAAEYLEARGLSIEEAEALGLGYDPSNKRLVIPWAGTDYYHIDRSTDGREPRYIKPPSKEVGKQPIYNPAALRNEAFFIVEGAIDALAVQACGYPAVALGGTQSKDVTAKLESTSNHGAPIVMLDNDERGAESAEKLSRELEAAGIAHTVATTETKDAGEWFKADREALRAFLSREYSKARTEAGRIKEEAYTAALRALRVMNPVDIATGIYLLEDAVEPVQTGFDRLDEVLGGGLYPGLYILGAVSSLGKTTFAVQVADQIAKSGRGVLFVTVEQSAKEITAKSLSRAASSSRRDFTTTDITNPKRRALWNEVDNVEFAEACAEYSRDVAPNMRIYEGKRQPSVNDIKKILEFMEAEEGTAPVVFIDYLQLLAAQDDRDTDKRTIDKNVMSLRQLARDLETPVFVISSLNRASYSEGVSMEAFKESGCIEYGADVLLGLQPEGMREHMRNVGDKRTKAEADSFIRSNKASDARQCEVVVLKNRSGRVPDEGIPFTFKATASTFTEGALRPQKPAMPLTII